MVPLRFFLALLSALYANFSVAQQGTWTTSPFSPFGLPLAVRSPYLNSWFPQGINPPDPGQSWPQYWSSGISGWIAAIVVDGIAYAVQAGDTGLNIFNGQAIQKAVSFSPTNTSFVIQTGPMDVTLTFLNPIEPNDLLRQSLPFVYMYMTAESNDGNPHNVRMYSDVSGEFLVEGPGLNVSWRADDDGNNIILSEEFVQPQPFGELGDHALDAIEYYCYKRINGTKTSWQISSDSVDRTSATNMSTSLNNTVDPGQRLLSDSWPLLGIQIDWGEITSTSEPAVFTLGLIRDPVIQYMLPNGTIQMRSPYFRSSFETDNDALKFFMNDFERAKQAAEAFDAKLLDAGSAFSAGYSDLLALTARQILSSIDITVAKGSDGNWNFTDTLVFMKNFGAAGSDTPVSNAWAQSVNTVDTLFAAFPAFLYFNPELAGYLLSPLLKYQDSPAYTLEYAAKNIGTVYPNATSDSINTSHLYGVEETSNMIIMTLAYSQRSGNNTLINNHYGLLQKWGQYLKQNALTPTNQQWADYFVLQNNLPTTNQTNLALKGIIAIASMSKIAMIAGNSDDASQFDTTASSFIQTWQRNALGSSQVDYFYNDADNTGSMYNLYADVLLGLDFVPSEVYSTLTSYYNNLISSNGGFGIPLMSEIPGLTSVSAMMLSAATVTSNATRNAMISQVHSYASSGFNNTPFGEYYNSMQGFIINKNIAIDGRGINSPTIGSVFSLLVTGSVAVEPVNMFDMKSKSKPGGIVGGIIGGIAGLALLGGCIFAFLRRHGHQAMERMSAGNYIPARAAQGPEIRGAGPGTIIEPFPYSDVESLKLRKEVNLLGGKASPLEWSLKGIPAELRVNSQEFAIALSNLAEASSYAGGGSSSSAGLLWAGSDPVPSLPETATDRDRVLRDEMESLRRDVARLLQNGIEAASEVPPPSYRDD